MEESSGFRKELVSRLLHLHFRDPKTRGLRPQWGGEEWGTGREGRGRLSCNLSFPPVSRDALQLMAEFLRIFVIEAAVRGVLQAQAEDLDVVDVDQLEKVLPQLLLDF
ncbi:rCG34515, isoform CRA_a [Rattus norvegicus]|uniref:Centromere protein X n=2 Tax=Rattus norvegicus TaxID=10116 RepID=A0ABK0LQZ1_RAT|nr:centromere protein X isoform 2 [Rattus norvegicus]EDM06882.1 rCG34515, isoform CRA_a [Rattus norvegicus]